MRSIVEEEEGGALHSFNHAYMHTWKYLDTLAPSLSPSGNKLLKRNKDGRIQVLFQAKIEILKRCILHFYKVYFFPLSSLEGGFLVYL